MYSTEEYGKAIAALAVASFALGVSLAINYSQARTIAKTRHASRMTTHFQESTKRLQKKD